jgi:hypothetical protein
MASRIRLQESVSSLFPATDDWKSKAAADIPAQVSVRFATGQTGLLDMKSPRGPLWARMIDEQRKAGLPVYAEIDPESGVVTNLRIPRLFKVEGIDTLEHGDLLVHLNPSHAGHFLLQTEPDFEPMRGVLEAALADGSEVLVTETRDAHEIIEVRKPAPSVTPPAEPPLPLPDDPPVSETRAGQVFDNMRAESCDPCNPAGDCITFLFPDDGCWIRAHMMSHLMRDGGPDTTVNPAEDPAKVWIRFGSCVNVASVNNPYCHVCWGWHVAPTLDVNLSGGGTEKWVFDPSVSPAPESEIAWRARQGYPGASLTDTGWTSYNWETDLTPVSFAQASQHLNYYRNELADRCFEVGPPPYSCVKGCFFIIDRNTFSDDEVEALMTDPGALPVEAALYLVLDGYSPYELGFTSATMQVTPTLAVSPIPSAMSITPSRLEFEDATHLNRPQRLTWVYDIGFTGTADFTTERVTLALDASIDAESTTGYLYLIRQPNPYENDGPTSWLSVDLRVFQIEQDQSKFGANVGTDPTGFITQALTNLNAGSSGGDTFDAISTDQQTSRLELSQMVGGKRVYNFAVAKVRYRALTSSATDVRVFFRLFPVATTSVAYDQATTYRRHTSGSAVIPLLGVKNGQLADIPCFAAPRINSASASMTTQPDPANVLTMPPNPSGAEVVRYFGCWLDINQTEPQFPLQPSPPDGPFPSARKSIQDLIRNEHQCLVSEIAFTPAPAQNGATPSVSDKLAQRNLAIVPSANPGLMASRRIPQTFEVRPSSGKPVHDELMFDWGNVPAGSEATLYLPGMDVDEMIRLSARQYHSYRLRRIDADTLRLNTGGITYLPIPFSDGNLPGMLTIDLPEGVKKGQVFRVLIRQVTGGHGAIGAAHRLARSADFMEIRHILGSFQLTIPVRDKAEMLPGQERLLSNLRWIERAIPAGDRWASVFGRYVMQVADRVDALGGNASKVAPSPTGEWRTAYRICLGLGVASAVLLALLLLAVGVLAGGPMAATAAVILVLLVAAVSYWRKHCRSTLRQQLIAALAGAVAGILALALVALLGAPGPALGTTLIAGAGIAVVAAVRGWIGGCFR